MLRTQRQPLVDLTFLDMLFQMPNFRTDAADPLQSCSMRHPGSYSLPLVMYFLVKLLYIHDRLS